MTEEDIKRRVQKAGGKPVLFHRFELLNLWGLQTYELTEKLKTFCEGNGFECDYDQAAFKWKIRLKDEAD